MVVSRVTDPALFKKMPEGIERENYYMTLRDVARMKEARGEVHRVAELTARVARAGRIDYGAFDIVNDDHGNYYVIDINATPYWGDGGHPALLAHLAAGLRETLAIADA
jgi:hypothetical protein